MPICDSVEDSEDYKKDKNITISWTKTIYTLTHFHMCWKSSSQIGAKLLASTWVAHVQNEIFDDTRNLINLYVATCKLNGPHTYWLHCFLLLSWLLTMLLSCEAGLSHFNYLLRVNYLSWLKVAINGGGKRHLNWLCIVILVSKYMNMCVGYINI